MRQAMISELKARLSSFLAAVRRGESIPVLDRRTPVARIVPVGENIDTLQLRPARLSVSELGKIAPVELRGGVDVVAMLREDRDKR